MKFSLFAVFLLTAIGFSCSSEVKSKSEEFESKVETQITIQERADSLLLLDTLNNDEFIDFDSIGFKGLLFPVSKEEISSLIGTPDSIYKPNYECGFLSSYTQGLEYYSLDYGGIVFTGNAKEGYIIDKVDFGKDSTVSIQFGSARLDGKIEFNRLAEIFGNHFAEHFKKPAAFTDGMGPNGAIIMFFNKSEDGLQLNLLNGKLVSVNYWSPC